MHPVISEYELRVHDRRRQELIMNAVRHRAAAALLTDASSPQGSRVSHRLAIDALSTLASGWLGRRRTPLARPGTTSTSV